MTESDIIQPGFKPLFKNTEVNVIDGSFYPRDKITNLGTFLKNMSEIADFEPFRYNGYSNSGWVDYIVNIPKEEKERLVIRFLDKSRFDSVERFFNDNKYSYTKENDNVSLCCEESTKRANIIKASFDFVETSYFANLLFINSGVPIKMLEINAYFKNFGREEEILQRKLVEAQIAFGETEHAHASSSFKIYPDRKTAEESIDKKIFDYLKKTVANDKSNTRLFTGIKSTGEFTTIPAPLEPPYDGAFVIGYEDKYRWPLTLPVEGLKDGTSKLGRLQSIGMAVPQILAVHSDGTTIVYEDHYSDDWDILPLNAHYNPERGILRDIGLANIGGSNYFNNYVAACKHCEHNAIPDFKNIVIASLKSRKIHYGFDMKGTVARDINYKINFDNLEVKVNEENTVLTGN